MKNNVLFVAAALAVVFECYSYSDFSLQLLDKDYDHTHIVVYETLENQKHSHIVFIKDQHNNRYVVKQDKSFSLKAQLQVALEMLSAYIAASIGISAHQVQILPVGVSFPGKAIIERPATIHTLMPGSVIRALKKKIYSGFSINQGGNPTRSARGLTPFVIKCMSWHQDLPLIVALDTFIANRDRSRKNLLYDEINNRFYAIDMALVYDMPSEEVFIPQLACDNVEFMIKNKVSFKKRKWRAIRCYYATLLQLLEHFPPQTICTLLDEFVQKSGLSEKYHNDGAFHNLLAKYKDIIEKAYSENERLVGLLSQLLKESPL